MSALETIEKNLIYVTAFLIGLHLSCFAQVNPVNIAGTNTIYSACQGANYKLAFDSNIYGYGPSPDYYYDKCPGEWNNTGHYSNEDNNTLKIEGEGLNLHGISSEGSFIQKKYFANVEFTKSSSYTISFTNRVHYPSSCSTTLRENVFTATYRKVIFIPTPPKPTLTALKAVVKFPESTTLISTGCPNTLAGNTEYYLYPNNSAFYNWSYQCIGNGEADFNNKQIWYEPFYIPYEKGYPYYKPGSVFRVRCEDNGCIGEISNPVAVSIQYVDPRCPDEETYIIDNFSRDGSKDYHHYTVETVICNKANNSNCTLYNVFSLLKNNKFNNAPVAGDFPAASLPSITSPLIPLQAHIPLTGSELLYKVDNTPVQNCQHINLPGVFGMGANLAALAAKVTATRAGEAVYDFTKVATDNRFVGNPILQYIDETAHSITNYTRPGHVLHPGKVTRIVVDECDRIKVVTIGSGKSFFGSNSAGKFMADRDINSGTALFQSIDQRVILDFNRLYR